MRTPGIIGNMITDLINRGLSRDDLADKLDCVPSHISNLRKGKGSLRDDKVGILAELHGGFSEREVLIQKYLEWLESEKGISPDEVAAAVSKLSNPVKQKDAA